MIFLNVNIMPFYRVSFSPSFPYIEVTDNVLKSEMTSATLSEGRVGGKSPSLPFTSIPVPCLGYLHIELQYDPSRLQDCIVHYSLVKPVYHQEYVEYVRVP